MGRPSQFLSASEAARRIGVSPKALRIYEQRGLLVPVRTEAGWRTYGPAEMARAAEIASLRTLGLGLAQVARALKGDAGCLELTLAGHEAALEGEAHQLAETIEQVRRLRGNLARSHARTTAVLAGLVAPGVDVAIAFDLPWPWGGERFELRRIRARNFITGPLGSGKTRLARAIADTVAGAAFLGLERLADDGAATQSRLRADPALKARVDLSLAWCADEGATISLPLIALLAVLESEACVLVIDMVEQGLDQATQEALIAHLRNRASAAPPLFLLTRSRAILDLETVGLDETVILCPANHGPPIMVAPYRHAPGYEAALSCLASPEVRARTDGIIAWRPPAG